MGPISAGVPQLQGSSALLIAFCGVLTRGVSQVVGGLKGFVVGAQDVHIRRLRKALGEAYENLVQTVRGTGYRFSTKA